jgi:hypothetical protein
MTKSFSFLVLLGAALAACGGVTSGGIVVDGGSSSGSGGGSGGSSGGSGSGGGSGGSSGSGGGSGSSSGGLVAACPAQAPANGASCSSPGITCEYGSDPNASCNTRASCPGTTWVVTKAGSGAACPTSSAGQGGCPTSYPGGTAGTCSPRNADCAYPQGRCDCTVLLGGPVHVNPDGGMPDPEWVCEQPGQGCTEPRPLLGSACSTEGETCDYGSCTLPGGVAEICTNGAWTETEIPCPL